MSEPKPRYVDDVPEQVEARLRAVCLALPDAYEERAWVGVRWKIRTRTFAHVLGIENDGGEVGHADPLVVLTFRSAGAELEMLRHAGPPFRQLGWGRDVIGLVLDEDTDWEEVAELLTESYCVFAPRKLVALLDRPDPV